MFIKQVAITLENKAGNLQYISQLLGTERINIRAISVASTTDVSTVKLVTDDPVKTRNILQSNNYLMVETDVIAIEVPDHPGGLQAILKPLKNANINVHYMYPHLGRAENGNAIVIIGVDKLAEAVEVLNQNWVHIFGQEIYSL